MSDKTQQSQLDFVCLIQHVICILLFFSLSFQIFSEHLETQLCCSSSSLKATKLFYLCFLKIRHKQKNLHESANSRSIQLNVIDVYYKHIQHLLLLLPIYFFPYFICKTIKLNITVSITFIYILYSYFCEISVFQTMLLISLNKKRSNLLICFLLYCTEHATSYQHKKIPSMVMNNIIHTELNSEL